MWGVSSLNQAVHSDAVRIRAARRGLRKLIAATAVVAAGAAGWLAMGTAAPTATQAAPAPARTAVSGVFAGNADAFVANTAARNVLRAIGVPIVGLYAGRTQADDRIRAALLAVKETGARPYVRVNADPFDGTAAGVARAWIRIGREVFGEERAYIEFDGSAAAGGVRELIERWNANVPALKSSAPPSYVFLAGLRSGYTREDDFAELAATASPRPDAFAWSEIPCGRDIADQVCERRLPTFAWHAEKVNKAVRARIGTTVPFFVGDWNVGGAEDERFLAASVIQRLTRNGLDRLAGMTGQGLMGATIGPAIATDDDDDHFGRGLVRRDGSLTPQGIAYRDTRR